MPKPTSGNHATPGLKHHPKTRLRPVRYFASHWCCGNAGQHTPDSRRRESGHQRPALSFRRRTAAAGLRGRCWALQLRGFTRSPHTPRGRSLTLGHVRLPARPGPLRLSASLKACPPKVLRLQTPTFPAPLSEEPGSWNPCLGKLQAAAGMDFNDGLQPKGED